MKISIHKQNFNRKKIKLNLKEKIKKKYGKLENKKIKKYLDNEFQKIKIIDLKLTKHFDDLNSYKESLNFWKNEFDVNEKIAVEFENNLENFWSTFFELNKDNFKEIIKKDIKYLTYPLIDNFLKELSYFRDPKLLSYILYQFSVIVSSLQFNFWWYPQKRSKIDSQKIYKIIEESFINFYKSRIKYFKSFIQKDPIKINKELIEFIINDLSQYEISMIKERIEILNSLKTNLSLDNYIFNTDYFFKKKIFGLYLLNFYLKYYNLKNENIFTAYKSYFPIDYRLPQSIFNILSSEKDMYKYLQNFDKIERILLKIKNKEAIIEGSSDEYFIRYFTLRNLSILFKIIKYNLNHNFPSYLLDAYFFNIAKFEKINFPHHYCKTINY